MYVLTHLDGNVDTCNGRDDDVADGADSGYECAALSFVCTGLFVCVCVCVYLFEFV